MSINLLRKDVGVMRERNMTDIRRFRETHFLFVVVSIFLHFYFLYFYFSGNLVYLLGWVVIAHLGRLLFFSGCVSFALLS